MELSDVLVIGAGPAGLTAATYLARYRRRVTVVHDGRSRALRIPLTHNAPGFPGGVTGVELVERMEAQARLYGACMIEDCIHTLRSGDDGYVARGERSYRARAVILATGIELNEVDLPFDVHEAALAQGCLRYCPVCDGYEARDRRVGVLGCSVHGAREALFLKGFSDDVILIPQEASGLTLRQQSELRARGVQVAGAALEALRPGPEGMTVFLRSGEVIRLDVLYPALGVRPRSELARSLGLGLTPGGCIEAGPGQSLGVPGLYAAGDVVEGLDQVSVAIGQGAVAATRAHNDLRRRDGEVLESAGS